MITVRYEKYYNDYNTRQDIKNFHSLEEVADWLFGMVQGKYVEHLHFIDPDRDRMVDGNLRLGYSSISSFDGKYTYWVEQIERDSVILYSCGTFTNKICHWDEEIKQWLRDCRNRMSNPQFNFSEDSVPHAVHKTDKKANARCWDAIDATVEKMVRTIAGFSDVKFKEGTLDDLNGDGIVADVREIVISYLTEKGGEFPFVDEDM